MAPNNTLAIGNSIFLLAEKRTMQREIVSFVDLWWLPIIYSRLQHTIVDLQAVNRIDKYATNFAACTAAKQ